MSSRSSSKPHPEFSFPGFHRVGFVRSAHGIRGELALGLFAAQADWREDAERISLLPPGADHLNHFNIIKLRPHKEGLIAQLEGISTRTQAETLRGAAVYIGDDLLVAEPGEPIYLKQIEGFAVIDPSGRELGRIVGFGTNGAQDLLLVQRAEGREPSMVPLVDEFLVEIDLEGRRVCMDLPPGLLEVGDE